MPQVKVEVHQIERTTHCVGVARGHRVSIDRPSDKGGQDQGPMGGELLLLGLGGCFMSNLIAALKARELSVEGLAVRVRGTLSGSPPRFTAATLEVEGRTEDLTGFDRAIEIAERGCIVANTLKPALALRVVRAAAAPASG